MEFVTAGRTTHQHAANARGDIELLLAVATNFNCFIFHGFNIGQISLNN